MQSGREVEFPLKKILQPLFQWTLQDQTFSQIVWSSKERPKPFWMSLELQCGFDKVCCSSSVHTAAKFSWTWLC